MSLTASIEHIFRPRLPRHLNPLAPLPRALPLLLPYRQLFSRTLSCPIAASLASTATQGENFIPHTFLKPLQAFIPPHLRTSCDTRPPNTDEDAAVKAASNRSLIDVNPPRGTRDFPPEEMMLRNWLFSNFREVSRLLSFEEVDFPVLESEALFIRKGGEEITQQLYNFEDKGGRRVVLRPEITPSLARLVIKQGKSLSHPLKWFTIGQCWRYERMTRGRRREHYQWNMDIIGLSKVRAEAELIHAVVLLFERLGITSSDVGIRISSRKVLQAVLQMHSIPEHLFSDVCVIVDKLGKITKEEIEKELMTAGLSFEAVEGIIKVLSLKSLSKLEEVLGSEDKAVTDLKSLFLLAEHYGYSQWINFDASIVRGLAYYTGIVFEAFDKEGKLRSICGGGRYDHLFSTFGSDDIPACGFGFGDAVILELLKEKCLLPDLIRHVDDIVFLLDEDLEGPASKIVSSIRESGRSVDLIQDKRLKWVFKQAERINADRLILVGNSEWERGMVRVKILATREEFEIKIDELTSSS